LAPTLSGRSGVSSPRRPGEGIPGPAPEGVELEERDHNDDQDVQDKAEEHPGDPPQHRERSMFGPVQAAASVFQGAARGTEGATVLSNVGRSYPNRLENLRHQSRL
jgi:hypothetical protein